MSRLSARWFLASVDPFGGAFALVACLAEDALLASTQRHPRLWSQRLWVSRTSFWSWETSSWRKKQNAMSMNEWQLVGLSRHSFEGKVLMELERTVRESGHSGKLCVKLLLLTVTSCLFYTFSSTPFESNKLTTQSGCCVDGSAWKCGKGRPSLARSDSHSSLQLMPFSINPVNQVSLVWHCCKPKQTSSQRERSQACNSLMPSQN